MKPYEIIKEWETESGLKASVIRINHRTFNALQRTFFTFDGNSDDHHFSGYVKVEEGHPLFEVEYDELKDHFEAHGEFTYSSNGSDKYPSQKTKGGWWFGFDCGHSGDSVEILGQEFVEKECERLAECFKAAAH